MRFYILRRLHFEASALSLRVYRFHHCRKARIAQRLFKSAADHICRVAFEAASQSFSHLSFGVTDLGGLCGNKVRESELCACHHYGRHRKIRTYRIDRGNSVLLRQSHHSFYTLDVDLLKYIEMRNTAVNSRITAADHFVSVSLAIFNCVYLRVARAQYQNSFHSELILP